MTMNVESVDTVSAVVKDLQLLKALFQTKMETKAPEYLALIQRTFDDKDVDNLIEQLHCTSGAEGGSRTRRPFGQRILNSFIAI
jgi:hypothetical protein